MKRTTRMLVAMPIAAAVVTIGGATSASALGSNAGCVARTVHSPAGPPGLYQSVVHAPRFGEQVTFVAHSETCFFG